jgi:hypothetical protein
MKVAACAIVPATEESEGSKSNRGRFGSCLLAELGHEQENQAGKLLAVLESRGCRTKKTTMRELDIGSEWINQSYPTSRACPQCDWVCFSLS